MTREREPQGQRRQAVKSLLNEERLTVPSDHIILFPNGLPGFEQVRRFCVVTLGDSNPFDVLQAVDVPELRFVTLDPFQWFPGYELELPEDAIRQLEIERPEDVVVRAIVVVKSPLEQSTVNLMAPLVINVRRRLACQLVLSNSRYSLRHPLTAPLPTSAGSASNESGQTEQQAGK